MAGRGRVQPGAALVVGASSGIGWAVAARLLDAGWRVHAASRRRDAPEGAVRQRIDVRELGSIDRGVAAVLAAEGRIDLLVVTTGITHLAAIEELGPAAEHGVMATNLHGPLACVRAVLPGMRAAGQGRIVVLGSVAGFLPAPFQGLYAASKHALAGACASLDHEVRPYGVRVTLVEPGFVVSDFDARAEGPDAPVAAYDVARPRVAAALARSVRGGMAPARVAAAVVRAGQGARPPRRVRPGGQAKLLRLISLLLPETVFAWGLRRRFDLPG
jgi:NAD(P)-dependent dehydrogenase (short-subunit alcohol dehydrogenase family)